MSEPDHGYRLIQYGDTFDLVHLSKAQIGDRLISMQEIVRSRIPADEVRALKDSAHDR